MNQRVNGLKKNKRLKYISYFLFCFLPLSMAFSGCVRLKGGVGVWKQGAEDEEPVSHQAGFDTAELMPRRSS